MRAEGQQGLQPNEHKKRVKSAQTQLDIYLGAYVPGPIGSGPTASLTPPPGTQESAA